MLKTEGNASVLGNARIAAYAAYAAYAPKYQMKLVQGRKLWYFTSDGIDWRQVPRSEVIRYIEANGVKL